MNEIINEDEMSIDNENENENNVAVATAVLPIPSPPVPRKDGSESSEATISPEPDDDSAVDRMETLKVIQRVNVNANPQNAKPVSEIKKRSIKKHIARTHRAPKKHSPDSTPDEPVYCICRKPDNGEWMIGCDFCDDWFHGKCIDMNEDRARLVVLFACPLCREQGKLPVWKRKCRLPECYNPIITKGSSRSKYCSKEHGLLFIKRQVESLIGVTESEMAALVNGTNNVEEFRKLGSELPIVPEADISAKVDSQLLEQIKNEKKEENCHLLYLDQRKKYIKLSKDRTKRVSEEIALEQGVKKRDVCGMDEKLLGSYMDKAFDGEYRLKIWQQMCFADVLTGRDGICLNERRKCLKHSGWQTIMLDDTLLEERQCKLRLEKLDKLLEDLYYQAKISILTASSLYPHVKSQV